MTKKFFQFFRKLLVLPTLRKSLSFFLFFTLLKKCEEMSFSLHTMRENTNRLFKFRILAFCHLRHSICKSFVTFHLTDLKFRVFLKQIFNRLFILFR